MRTWGGYLILRNCMFRLRFAILLSSRCRKLIMQRFCRIDNVSPIWASANMLLCFTKGNAVELAVRLDCFSNGKAALVHQAQHIVWGSPVLFRYLIFTSRRCHVLLLHFAHDHFSVRLIVMSISLPGLAELLDSTRLPVIRRRLK